MSYVKIENYDGQKGYLIDSRFRLGGIELEDGVSYLIELNTPDEDRIFRVVKEDIINATALAVEITNQERKNAIMRQYGEHLEEITLRFQKENEK